MVREPAEAFAEVRVQGVEVDAAMAQVHGACSARERLAAVIESLNKSAAGGCLGAVLADGILVTVGAVTRPVSRMGCQPGAGPGLGRSGRALAVVLNEGERAVSAGRAFEVMPGAGGVEPERAADAPARALH